MRIYSKLPQDFTAGIDGKTFTLNGASVTEVDDELGAAWLQQYAHSGPVKDGLIGIEPERKARSRGQK